MARTMARGVARPSAEYLARKTAVQPTAAQSFDNATRACDDEYFAAIAALDSKLAATNPALADAAQTQYDLDKAAAEEKYKKCYLGSGSAANKPVDARTDEQKAADERLAIQCLLLDLIPKLEPQNQIKRFAKSHQNIVGMNGDTNYFTSFINGSVLKSYFLDFTTQQLSSLVPTLRLYKVLQNNQGTTSDYLIPFSTHTAWKNNKTSHGSIEDILENNIERPMDVGVKSFNWTFEGTNPVAARADISAKLVLFSPNLNNLIEKFDIYPIINTASPTEHSFSYVDMILRSNVKTDRGDFSPDYYTTKIEIAWRTKNSSLFTTQEMETLRANTTTMLLTLIDHSFDFSQDGSLTLSIDYRAYFEGVLFSDKADILKTKEQQDNLDVLKCRVRKLAPQPTEDDEGEDLPHDKEAYEAAQKVRDEKSLEIRKASFLSIIDHLSNPEDNKMHVISVHAGKYSRYKAAILTGGIINPEDAKYAELTPPSVFDSKPEASADAGIALATGVVATTTLDKKTELTTLVPLIVDGNVYPVFFFLGDLLEHIIEKAYSKMEDIPNKPKFLIGSAIYRVPENPSQFRRINIMDIPVDLHWFTEWFTTNIIGQDRTEYAALYFIRDLCSKLINNIMSSRCDKLGTLKLRNKFNIAHFDVMKIPDSEDNVLSLATRGGPNTSKDLTVDEIQALIFPAPDGVNPASQPGVDYSKKQQYVAIYCYDNNAPKGVECDEDHNNGIYHFYFGRDRGLVKNIKFERANVVGLREANYARNSSNSGLEQLMMPYDVTMDMIGNNLFINGMMIFINPSGFGRSVGMPDQTNSVSYKLKLGGYHTIYRVESSIKSDGGYGTTVKARWVSSGAKEGDSYNKVANDKDSTTGNPAEECGDLKGEPGVPNVTAADPPVVLDLHLGTHFGE